MKRSLCKTGSTRVKTPKTPRALLESVQKALQTKDFAAALEGAEQLATQFRDSEETTVYLTSMVWKIRARQGLGHDRESIREDAMFYAQEAERCAQYDRVVQGLRIAAQVDLDAGRWSRACETLEHALDVAILHQIGRDTLELLMHLSAIELKQCHYLEAIDFLSRAMNAIQPAGLVRDDMRELAAVGHRQLCELYDTVGDGEKACNALEAAQNAGTSDPEERWLQMLWLSRFDRRSGDADSCEVRLKKIESDVAQQVRRGNARREQVEMIHLERIQAMWTRGQWAKAIAQLDGLEKDLDAKPLRQAVALQRFQWAVEIGKPAYDADACGAEFAKSCEGDENVDIRISLAAALTQAAIEIERGNFEPTLESLLHIAQAASFTQLIPYATRALALRGQIFLAQGEFERAAQDGHDACETFVAHVDDVAARQAAAMMLLAQVEISRTHGEASLDENEKAAFDQLLHDLDRFEAHHHEVAFLDLGISLVRIAAISGQRECAKGLLERLEPHIDAAWMAHRAMQVAALKGRLWGDEKSLEQAREIARCNGFVLDERRLP